MRLNSLSPVEGCLVMGGGEHSMHKSRRYTSDWRASTAVISPGRGRGRFRGWSCRGSYWGFLAPEVALGFLEILDRAGPY